MKQSNYLCVIYTSRTRKKIHSPALLHWFLLFGKIQDGDLDGNHVWWHYRPPATPPPIKYSSSCREDQRLSTGSKIVSKYCSISKTRGTGFPSTPPPLNHVGVMTSCTSEGIKSDQRVWKTSRWKSVSKAWAYVAKSHSTGTQYRQLRRLIRTPTQEYIGAKTAMHDIPCTFWKVFDHWI